MNRQQIVHPAQRNGNQRNLARIARYAAPDRKFCSSPVGVRPPSGKTNSGIPARSALTAIPRLESVARGLLVSIGICPDLSKYHPMNAIGQSSFFARMRNWKGSEAKDDRRIHVRGMVGGVDGHRALAQILRAANLQ